MKINTGNGTMPLLVLLAIWSVSAIMSLPGLAISPIMGDLNTVFPKATDLELQLLTSLPSLLIIPFVLISGKLSTKKDNASLLILGLLIYSVSGVLSVFADKMWMLILLSCTLGVGAGMTIPLAKSLIVDYFSGKYRVKQLGISSSINNLTLTVATVVAGYLANVNWHMPFLVYTLPIIALALAFPLKKYIRNNKTVTQKNDKADTASTPSAKIDKKKLAELTGFYFIITFCVIVISYYLSFLVDDYKLVHSLSGVMISVFFLAIMLPGFLINKIIDVFGNNVNLISAIVITVGLLLIGIFKDPWIMGLGCALAGLGYGTIQPVIYDKTAAVSPANLSALGFSIVLSANYVAVMVCPFIIKSVGTIFHIENNRFPFLFNAAIMAIIAVLAYLKRKSFLIQSTSTDK